ncbi:MAG: ADP-glyceromanno-heptose 6-epimerase [Magnetococcus sp. MYC-9]
MYIVTGGAGFIGANIVAGLNQQGERQILVVDNLLKGDKFLNLRDLEIADYMDKGEFRDRLRRGALPELPIRAIFHQGACSDTMEADGRYMMDNNYTYSKELLQLALQRAIPFIYASSAAVYGASQTFVEDPRHEKPLNVYGYSKLLFDRHVEQLRPRIQSTVVGLRYFNVYGPREQHKGRMASMVYQLCQQLRTTGVAQLFEGSGGYGHGEQRRDFICVGDVVQVNLFLAQQLGIQGVCNVGTGQSRSFNAIARHLCQRLGRGEIRYKPMPEGLDKKYQNFTEADVGRLRGLGFDRPFTPLEEGVDAFLRAEQAWDEGNAPDR